MTNLAVATSPLTGPQPPLIGPQPPLTGPQLPLTGPQPHSLDRSPTHRAVDPLLVALHAVARVDHDELAGVVHAALIAPDLARLAQHPVLSINTVT